MSDFFNEMPVVVRDVALDFDFKTNGWNVYCQCVRWKCNILNQCIWWKYENVILFTPRTSDRQK